MIKLERFEAIKNEVECAFNQALDKVKELSLCNYILFIGNGEYMDSLENSPILNPNTIDDRTWFYKDETRLIFLSQFLKGFYSFGNGETEVKDDSFRINLEFMVYSHIWESFSFLNKMFRLAHLVNGEDYEWKVLIPEMGKHDFIRNKIKEYFIKQNMDFGTIIPKAFHTQLRNAFAHSQYSIDVDQGRINLANYKGQSWEFRDISTNDWSERFAYSIWMSFLLLKIVVDRRISLIDDFGTDTFTVQIPSKDKKTMRDVDVVYMKEKDSFHYKTK